MNKNEINRMCQHGACCYFRDRCDFFAQHSDKHRKRWTRMRELENELAELKREQPQEEAEEKAAKGKQAEKTVVAPVTAPAPRTKKQEGQTSLQRSLREGEAEEERWMHEEQKWATYFEFMMKAEEEWDATALTVSPRARPYNELPV